MAEITKEQAAQLESDLAIMKRSGLSQDDMDAYMDERLRGWGVPMPPGQGSIAAEALRGSQAAAMFMGPAIGGFYGAQLTAGRNALPFLGGVGRALTQFGGEATGIAAGDVAGRFVAGVPQNPVETGKAALGGAAAGSLMRGAVQVGGLLGAIPESAIQSAAEPVKIGKVPVPIPNYQRVMRAGPQTATQVMAGQSPEINLVERASRAAKALKNTITKARMEKAAIIRTADSQGVRIPVAPIQDAMRDHLITDPAPITREAKILNTRIKGTVEALGKAAEANGGTLSPGQIDALIRKQLRPRVYTASGQPSHAMYAAPLADAEDAATQLLTDALPGNIAQKNLEISERLSSAELAERLFGDPDKAGVASRLANAFKPNNELTARALKTLTQHDRKLAQDAFNLYTRRQFAGDIREPEMGGQAGFFGTMVRKPVETVTRGVAPLQRFTGGMAAGSYEAFKRALEQTP